MEPQLENQSGTNAFSRQNILDIVSGVGVVGGTVASLVSQQVAFAAIPLSISVALNIVNRRQLENTLAQNQQGAIAQLNRQINDNQTTLSEHLYQFEQQTQAQLSEQSQDYQNKFDRLSEQLEGLQQTVADLGNEHHQLHDFTQNLNVQHKQLEDVVGELKQIENFSQAIRANPNSAEFYYQRGLSFQNLGDKQGAIEDYTQAIKIDPTYAKAYHNRGILNAELENRKRAVEDLRQAAKYYFEQGDIESYRKARDLSKEFYELRYSSIQEVEETQLEVTESLAVRNLFN